MELDPIREMGAGQAGQRRIIPIVGGRVEGPEVTGKILNLGADWQTIWSNGVAELDTRYAIETDDGAVVEIRNYGYRHGPEDVIAAIVGLDETETLGAVEPFDCAILTSRHEYLPRCFKAAALKHSVPRLRSEKQNEPRR